MPKRARKYFCFLLILCVPVICFNKEITFEHVLAKAILLKAALLDWSAPGLSGQSSIELRNTSTGKSTSAFRRDCFKLSILQDPLQRTKLELPIGLKTSTQGMDKPAVAGNKCSGLDLHFRLAFCKSGPKPLGLQIVAQASGDGMQEETSQYSKLKAVSSEGSCRFSSWCVA